MSFGAWKKQKKHNKIILKSFTTFALSVLSFSLIIIGNVASISSFLKKREIWFHF